jgi:hypothetical protein
MLNTEEIINRLNHLYLEDNLEDDYIDRIRKQQHLLLEIVTNSPLASSIDISIINTVYDQVVLSVQAFMKGNIQDSILQIKKFIFQEYTDRRYVYLRRKRINPHDLIAYRTRKCDTHDLFSRTEMMHIPNHKRHLVSNQRFSLSGYPCLYVGASIYGCWEELGRPDIEKFNIVCVCNEKLIHFVDLTLPNFNDKNLTPDYIYASILPWLCSFRAKHKGCAFVEEYTIPQILMSILISSRKRSGSVIQDIMAYQGLMYTSTIYNTSKDLFKDEKLMTNYVVPILGNKINDYGLCEYVCDYFSLTEPTSLTNERVIAEQGGIVMYDGERKYTKYEMTEFGQLEEKLKGRDFKKIE